MCDHSDDGGGGNDGDCGGGGGGGGGDWKAMWCESALLYAVGFIYAKHAH